MIEVVLGKYWLHVPLDRQARDMERQVDETFFLFRAIGYATFAFQGSDVQVALAEIPRRRSPSPWRRSMNRSAASAAVSSGPRAAGPASL